MANFNEQSKNLYNEALATNASIGVKPKNFSQAESIIKSLFEENIFNPNKTQTGGSTLRPALTPRSYITNLDNILKELGRGDKALKFILSQTALGLLNPTMGQGKLINPVAMILGPPPLLGGLTTPYFDVPLASMNPVSNGKKDAINDLYKGNVKEFKIEAGIPPYSINGPKTRFPSEEGNSDVTIDTKYKQLNAAHEERTMSEFTAYDPFSTDRLVPEFKNDSPGSPAINKIDYSKIFNDRNTGPDFGTGPKGFGGNETRSSINIKSLVKFSDNYRKYENKQRNFDTFYNQEDIDKGYLESSFDSVNDEQVVPFYFSDLRRPERFLAFRAFLKSFSENISPSWNEEEYMGRVDNVSTYKSTSRSFSLSFVIAAMSPEGLASMWRKINNLCKMTYPTFRQGIIDKSPIVRMRVGDVCADGSGNGLPGKINSISFSYDDSTWEIEKNLSLALSPALDWGIVPQFGLVTIEFSVIHENNPVLNGNYEFDMNKFRKAGR